MANLRKSLEYAEGLYGEKIESIVVGVHYRRAFTESAAQADENIVLTRDAGLAKIDEEYDDGYGGEDCFPLMAWTASRVFFIAEYDGATWLTYVYRNPRDCAPDFSGQSMSINEKAPGP